MNLKLRLWGYNEKNMGFHLKAKKKKKKYTSGCTLGDENVFGIRAFKKMALGVKKTIEAICV